MTFLQLGFILFSFSPFTHIGFYEAIGYSYLIEVNRPCYRSGRLRSRNIHSLM